MSGCLQISLLTLVNMVPAVFLVVMVILLIMVVVVVVFFGLPHKLNTVESFGREEAGEVGSTVGVFVTTVICCCRLIGGGGVQVMFEQSFGVERQASGGIPFVGFVVLLPLSIRALPQ